MRRRAGSSVVHHARRPWQGLCPACSMAIHSGSTPPTPELVRDFIWRALYDPQSGYFATTTCLHAPVVPLDFTKLRGKSEYTEKLAELYAAEDAAWLTPVEIFAVRPTVLNLRVSRQPSQGVALCCFAAVVLVCCRAMDSD